LEQLRIGLTYVIDYGNQKFVSIGWFPIFVVDETGNVLYEGGRCVSWLRLLEFPDAE